MSFLCVHTPISTAQQNILEGGFLRPKTRYPSVKENKRKHFQCTPFLQKWSGWRIYMKGSRDPNYSTAARIFQKMMRVMIPTVLMIVKKPVSAIALDGVLTY